MVDSNRHIRIINAQNKNPCIIRETKEFWGTKVVQFLCKKIKVSLFPTISFNNLENKLERRSNYKRQHDIIEKQLHNEASDESLQ